MLMYYSLILFLGGISFAVKRKHLLLMLLSLEYMVIFLFFIIFLYLSLEMEYYFSMIFMIFTVCEGALGLSVLVSLVRTHGNDYFSSFSILW
uniref:NADH-ubiquinone oxidoreductase chain 4L n=1 Tax=Tenebrionoidea sp. 23 KM-2017 TaxID=2219479 RepID=A0A346RJA0_9CUCU|nr:NADH dehydrogenase subunit 4L [Tenebrionoidea sp. 23 KM-2017]